MESPKQLANMTLCCAPTPRRTASLALPHAYSKAPSRLSGCVPSGWIHRYTEAPIIADSHGVLYAMNLANEFFLTLNLDRPGLWEAGWTKGSASYWPTSQEWGLNPRHSDEHVIESGTQWCRSTEDGVADLARRTKRALQRRYPGQSLPPCSVAQTAMWGLFVTLVGHGWTYFLMLKDNK